MYGNCGRTASRPVRFGGGVRTTGLTRPTLVVACAAMPAEFAPTFGLTVTGLTVTGLMRAPMLMVGERMMLCALAAEAAISATPPTTHATRRKIIRQSAPSWGMGHLALRWNAAAKP